jgi:hypothetical protein
MGASASNYFVHDVQALYELAIRQVLRGNVARHGINWYTDHAPPAYVMAVAAVEAFLNEMMLSDSARGCEPDSVLWKFERTWIDRLDLGNKLLLVPELLFGRVLDSGRQPYQDMALLIRVRNDFVHYKMADRPPNYVAVLDERRVALRSPGQTDYDWLHKLCSSEGIRWANNTMAATATALFDLIPEDHFLASTFSGLCTNFAHIPPDVPRQRLREAGWDPEGDGTS